MPHCYNNISKASENGAQAFSGLISHGYKVSLSLFVLLLILLNLLPEGSRFKRFQPGYNGSARIFLALFNPPRVRSG